MLIRLSNPEGLAVELDDLKADLRVDHTSDDDKLTRHQKTAVGRYEDFTGRIMLPTELEWRTAAWREPICIPVHPVRSITEVAYLDEDHAEQTLDAGDWYMVSQPSGADIRFTDAFSAPSLSDRPHPVRVRFVAGYDDPAASGSGDDPNLVAEDQDRGVITLMVQWLYDRDEPMPDDLLRRMAGNRRIYR